MDPLSTTDKQVDAATTSNPSQQDHVAYIQPNDQPTSSSMVSNPAQTDSVKNMYWRYVPPSYHPAYDPMDYPPEAQQIAADGSYPQPQLYPPELIAYDYSNNTNYNGYGIDQNQQAYDNNSVAGVVDYSVMPCWPPQAILPHQQNQQIPLLDNINQFYQVAYEDQSLSKNRPNSANSYDQFPGAYEDYYSWGCNIVEDPYQYNNSYYINNPNSQNLSHKTNFYQKGSKKKSYKQKRHTGSIINNSFDATAASTILPLNPEDSYSYSNYTQKNQYKNSNGFHSNAYYENRAQKQTNQTNGGYYQKNLDPTVLNKMANLSVDPQYGYYNNNNTMRNQYPSTCLRDNNNNSNQNNQINYDKYNPKNFMITNELEGARTSRFFIIKSYSIDDIIKSIKYNVWCSTEEGNRKLDKAFIEAQKTGSSSVYLFFSVNGSGQFCGMAQMLSRIDYDKKSKIWTQNKWTGSFNVNWIYVKDVPNAKFRHIVLKYNEFKPVTNSRDTQEVLFDEAYEVLCIIRSHVKRTSILDSFDII